MATVVRRARPGAGERLAEGEFDPQQDCPDAGNGFRGAGCACAGNRLGGVLRRLFLEACPKGRCRPAAVTEMDEGTATANRRSFDKTRAQQGHRNIREIKLEQGAR